MVHGGLIVEHDEVRRSAGNWPLITATIYIVGETDLEDEEILDRFRDQG